MEVGGQSLGEGDVVARGVRDVGNGVADVGIGDRGPGGGGWGVIQSLEGSEMGGLGWGV